MFEHAEYSKWISKKTPIAREYAEVTAKLVVDSAARGFVVPPATVQDEIVNAGKIVKLELTKVNGALYGEQAEVMFQIEEFEVKLALEYDKLEMALRIQGLLNVLKLEQTEMAENHKRDKAYLDQLAADVEKRKYGIIIGKADIESAMIEYKMREVEAQRLGLNKELELIAAQAETARERLKMIKWLNELIIKERAIIDIEQRRAVVLQDIIAIKNEIATIKEGMIPLYEDKAAAKQLQATAITDEIQWKKLLIELGFEKVKIKDAEADAKVSISNAQTALEVNRLALVNATNALTQLKAEHQVDITEYGNLIARQVLAIEDSIRQTAIDLRLDTANIRLATDVNNDIALTNNKIANIQEEVVSEINKIMDIANTVRRTSGSSRTDSFSITNRRSEIAQAISS
jgi:hypothetical protein